MKNNRAHYINSERNAVINEIIRIGRNEDYDVSRYIAVEVFTELEWHPCPGRDDVLSEIESRFNKVHERFQSKKCVDLNHRETTPRSGNLNAALEVY